MPSVSVTEEKLQNDQISSSNIARKLAKGIAWPTIDMFIVSISMFLTAFFGAIWGYIPLWGSAIINTVALYILFTPLHEAVHGAISGTHQNLRWLNTLIGRISGFFMVIDFAAYKEFHLRHHRHTNDPNRDPEYFLKANNKLSGFMRSMFMIHYFQYLFFKEARWHLNKPGNATRIMKTIGFYTVLFALWALMYSRGYLPELLILWILPSYLATGILLFLFAHLPHTDSQEQYKDTSLIQFPSRFAKLGEWLMMQQNYHLIHHIMPKLPFYQYKSAYYQLKDELENQNTPVKKIG